MIFFGSFKLLSTHLAALMLLSLQLAGVVISRATFKASRAFFLSTTVPAGSSKAVVVREAQVVPVAQATVDCSVALA